MDEYPSVRVQIWRLLLSHTWRPGFWPDEVTKATPNITLGSQQQGARTHADTQGSAVSTTTALYRFLQTVDGKWHHPSCCLLHSRTTEQQKDQQSVRLHAASVLMHRCGSLISNKSPQFVLLWHLKLVTLATTLYLGIAVQPHLLYHSQTDQKIKKKNTEPLVVHQ